MVKYATEFVGRFFAIRAGLPASGPSLKRPPVARSESPRPTGRPPARRRAPRPQSRHFFSTHRLWLLTVGSAGAVGLGGVAGCGDEPPPLDLVPSGELTGSVVATDLGRVPTTTLTLTSGEGSPRTAQTDAGGTYFFTAVPVGTWTVTVLPPTAFQVADGEPASKEVTIEAGALVEEDFLLRPLGR